MKKSVIKLAVAIIVLAGVYVGKTYAQSILPEKKCSSDPTPICYQKGDVTVHGVYSDK